MCLFRCSPLLLRVATPTGAVSGASSYAQIYDAYKFICSSLSAPPLVLYTYSLDFLFISWCGQDPDPSFCAQTMVPTLHLQTCLFRCCPLLLRVGTSIRAVSGASSCAQSYDETLTCSALNHLMLYNAWIRIYVQILHSKLSNRLSATLMQKVMNSKAPAEPRSMDCRSTG